MNKQETNADVAKRRLSLVPVQVIKDIAEVIEFGSVKYGKPNNWKEVDISLYRDALFHHLLAYLEDPEGADGESGIEHYKHMAANMSFICAMESWKGSKGEQNDYISK